MGGAAAKRKGSSYEREVAKFLTEKFDETFIRAPQSGAYVGGKNAGRKQFLHEGQIRNFKGDIVPGPSYEYMNIECKSYKDFPFHRLIQGFPVPILDQWIEQTLDVADEGDLNIIFMKFNRIGQFVCWQSDDRTTDVWLSAKPPIPLISYYFEGKLWWFGGIDAFFERNLIALHKDNTQ